MFEWWGEIDLIVQTDPPVGAMPHVGLGSLFPGPARGAAPTVVWWWDVT
jgi:hypothetical protein